MTREFAWVSDELRARMADGRCPVGSFLPPQRVLAAEFGVSRDTVQRVLRELACEGWIESRRGSGSRVVGSQHIASSAPKASRSPHGTTLALRISEAFEHKRVTLDVYTLTSESLDTHIRFQEERIRAGSIHPERIALRMLLPSASMPLPYPRARNEKDDPRLRDRLHTITQRHTDSLLRGLRSLAAEQLVPDVDVQIRHVPLTPAFKLYLLNGSEALHGMYVVTGRPVVLDNGDEVDALDVLGVGAALTHHAKATDPDSAFFVDKMQKWFDSVWVLLAE